VGLIDEKTEDRKSRATVPLKITFLKPDSGYGRLKCSGRKNRSAHKAGNPCNMQEPSRTSLILKLQFRMPTVS
jgi:hypothetical protein